jgi:hypothetical protein
MTLAARKQALLDLVEADRARRCDALLGEARVRAAQALGEAHAEARLRVRNAFAEERDRLQAIVRAAQARLATRRRLREQRREAALLESAFERLPAALHDRWQRTDTRAAWIARAIAQARRGLPSHTWTVMHATPFAEHAMFPERAEFVADAALRAGLTIDAGGNVVDGSLRGLLLDRAEIGARILAHIEAAQ